MGHFERLVVAQEVTKGGKDAIEWRDATEPLNKILFDAERNHFIKLRILTASERASYDSTFRRKEGECLDTELLSRES